MVSQFGTKNNVQANVRLIGHRMNYYRDKKGVLAMRKIGFWAENEQSKGQKNETTQFKAEKTEAKESVVRVYFPARGFACSYYNDKFDLKKGDGVYVDGKLEGLLGFITEVSYCFKIRLSEYKRVIYRVDTEIRGKLYLLGDFFAAFEKT